MPVTSTRFATGYMDNAVFGLERVIRDTVDTLRPFANEFDTLVGTGFSGGIVIPTLALQLRKRFVLIRKETDDSHHGAGALLGELGNRWIFVDDFTSSGHTRDRVLEKIGEAAARDCHFTQYVGSYYYGTYIPTKNRYRRAEV